MNKIDLKKPELASWPNKSCFHFISSTTEVPLYWPLQTRAAATPQLHGLTNCLKEAHEEEKKHFLFPARCIIWRASVLGVLKHELAEPCPHHVHIRYFRFTPSLFHWNITCKIFLIIIKKMFNEQHIWIIKCNISYSLHIYAYIIKSFKK